MTPENPAALARELIDVVGGLNDRLDKAEAGEHRMRVVVGALGAALAAVTIALAVVAFFLARSNSDRLAADHRQAVAQCRNINATRGENRDLWRLDAALDAAQSSTPAQLATARMLVANADHYFASEDCSKLVP